MTTYRAIRAENFRSFHREYRMGFWPLCWFSDPFSRCDSSYAEVHRLVMLQLANRGQHLYGASHETEAEIVGAIIAAVLAILVPATAAVSPFIKQAITLIVKLLLDSIQTQTAGKFGSAGEMNNQIQRWAAEAEASA